MKLNSLKDVEEFKKIVDSCAGDVTLESQYGDRYNLKSALSQYVGLAALLGGHAEELELFCQLREDEGKFLSFFNEHREDL